MFKSSSTTAHSAGTTLAREPCRLSAAEDIMTTMQQLSMPAARATPTLLASTAMLSTRLPRKPSTTAAESSVQLSSTTMTATGSATQNAAASSASRHWRSAWSSLFTGTTTPMRSL
jgi:hypothetical protein